MSTDIEKKLLGSILIDPERTEEVFDYLNPEMFCNRDCRALFVEMLKLNTDGYQITSPILKSVPDLVTALMAEVISIVGWKSCMKKISEKYRLKELRMACVKIVDDIDNERVNKKEAFDAIEKSLVDMLGEPDEKGLEKLGKTSVEITHSLDEVASGKAVGIKTGIHVLDSNGWDLQNGDLIVIAGRPSMGKSALLLDLALNSEKNSCFFSVEMRTKVLYERKLAAETGMEMAAFRNPDVIKNRSKDIVDAMQRINQYPVWVDDNARKTPTQVYRQARRFHEKHGLGMILIDYLGRMTLGEKYRKMDRREEVTIMCHQLKEYAKILNVPVVEGSQLNRVCESRKDKRPMLSDLRESGDLEQDADMVWLLYRPEFYFKTATPGLAECIVAKCRNGKTGVAKLYYDKTATHFSDWGQAEQGGFAF